MQGKIGKYSPIRSAVNNASEICNGHLYYLWGRRWKEKRVGSWMQGVGVGGAKRLGEGRVRRLFRIHELVSVIARIFHSLSFDH